MKHIITALAFILTATTIISCDNGYDCDLNNTSYNNITFYTTTDGKEQPYAYPEELTVSLMINGKDSIMVNHITDATHLMLPMNYTDGIDTVIFHYNNNIDDSLYITHIGKPYYKSMECGILMFHQIEGIKNTNKWIERATIMNNTVNFQGHENIRIYFYQ
jgi:hypothetical protein